MKQKIGDALKKAVEVKPQEEEEKSRSKPSSALMNRNRRNIFQYLCRNPCTGTGRISKELGLSRSTVSWHLNYLQESGYVESFEAGKKFAYCPIGLISRDAMQIFYQLNKKDHLDMFNLVASEPGRNRESLITESGISKGHATEILKGLEETNLITTVRDGRNVRYYPTDELARIISDDSRSLKDFIKKITKKMSSEHLMPQVTELKGGGVTIQIKVPGRNARIEIPYRLPRAMDDAE